jgi:hypothetical protein
MDLMQLLIVILGWLSFGPTTASEWVGQVLVYLYDVIMTGDTGSDWRTHITDPAIRAAAEYVARYLVKALGL